MGNAAVKVEGGWVLWSTPSKSTKDTCALGFYFLLFTLF